MKSFFRISFILVLSIVLSNCASRPKTESLTDQQWKEIGGRVIDGSYEDVFESAILTMQRNGYSVVNQNKKTGVILTDLKPMGASATGFTSGSNTRSTTQVRTFSTGQLYELKVVKRSPKTTEVYMRPSIFVNGQNFSIHPIWILDGPNGQKTILAGLLDQIQSSSVQ